MNWMFDREKVINGLEHCSNKSFCNDSCPYSFILRDPNFGIDECTTQLAHDALEMLKEQKPVLLKNQHKSGGHFINANSPWKSKCPWCGKKIEGRQTRFCKYCGQAVKWND